MNNEEYKKWEEEASRALCGKYSSSEIKVILDWFRSIKGSDERDLIGNDRVEAMLKFVDNGPKWSLYDSMMARLFIYAPLIIDEKNNND